MGNIKIKSKRVARGSKRLVVKAATASVKRAKKSKQIAKNTMHRAANTKTYQKSKRAVKKTHKVIAQKPHEKLMNRFPKYNKWHSWQFKRINHNHIHSVVAIAWVMLVGFLVASSVPTISALSTWSQSDWSGGVGTNPTNQYSSTNNIDTSQSGGLQLVESSNLFNNSDFNTNVSDWSTANTQYSTDQQYTGVGSAKVTAGIPTQSTLYDINTINGAANYSFATTQLDLNDDGYEDLVVSNTTSNSFSTFISNGNGTFQTGTNIPTSGRSVFDVNSADFNNDGYEDLIITYITGYNGFSVYLNDGLGDITANKADYPLLSSEGLYCKTTINYFNNDNNIDIAFSCNNSGNRHIAFNDGSGSFLTTIEAPITKRNPTYDNSIASPDINNDGLHDLAWMWGSNQHCVAFAYILNNGAGFNAEQIVNPGDCTGFNMTAGAVSSADFNSDGYEDIAVLRYKGNSFSPSSTRFVLAIYTGNASGVPTLLSEKAIPASEYYYKSMSRVADFNNDGNLDIIINVYGLLKVHILLGNGDGTFQDYQATSISTAAYTYGLSVGDLNSDKKTDVVVTNYANSTASAVQSLLNRTAGDTLLQPKKINNTEKYYLEGYVYTNGNSVSATDIQFYANGQNITTIFSSTSKSGWYKLTGEVVASQGWTGYGVQVKQGKIAYLDDVRLYNYADSGTLTSVAYDLTFGGDWGALNYTTDKVDNTIVKMRSSNNSDMSGAADFAGCSSIISGTDLTGTSCMNNNDRYVQYQITLTNDNGDTPIFEDIALSYSAWDTIAPDDNASNISMKRSAGGDNIVLNGWSNGSKPYFEWDAGVDNAGGTGIKGYCLYLGQDNSGNPVSTKGLLGTSPLDTGGACQFAVASTNIDTATANYLATALTTSNSNYYLNIKAIDNVNNVFSGASEQFSFRFDNTSAKNPEFVTAPSQFVASKNVTFTWPTSGAEAPSDNHSGLAGLQYKIGNGGVWYGDSHSGAQDINDLLTNDGSYTTVDPTDYNNLSEGNNVFYFRTWDNAGNVSSVYTTTVLKLNTTSPSSPQNVTADPSTNTSNSFAFSWAAPSSFQGSVSNLTYCYTVNTLPTLSSCTFTNAGVTSLPAGSFATQPGDNTFYVVAKDEAGNINYATAANTTFTANTAAPGIPLDLNVADVSTKSTSTWRLALSWNPPTNIGAGVDKYAIYRSTDNNNFSQVASTSGTSYVDGGLTQRDYYYKIKACDSANNCGAFSSIVKEYPTGKFTSPALLTAQPSVSGVSTKRAVVSWSTNRNSDSKVSIGTSKDNYQPFQIASNQQTTDHKVDLNNLTPGTTYFAKVSWTDEDGNTGSSSEFTFKTNPAPSTQEVETKRTTLSAAQIRFTSVDAAKVVIQYGLSDNFGGAKEITTSLNKSTYDVELTGLNDGAKYFYRLNTFDADGNEYVGSTVLTFTTPARPRIENLRFQPVDGEATSTQRITWTTNVPASSLIRFSAKDVANKEVSDSKLVTEHEVVIRDLLDDTEYNFVAESRDKDGNLAVSDSQVLKTALDTRPPKISNISVETSIRGAGSEARGQVVVSWETDEPATSQVAYGEGSNIEEYNNKTSEDGSLTTEHIVIVSDLATSKVYSVMPLSADAAKNSTNGESQSAIIGRASDDVISIVLNTLRKVFGF